MNLSTISSVWCVFKAGGVVANPAAWKKRQVSVNQVGALLCALAALAKGLGYDLKIDDATLMGVAGGVFAVVNWVFTVVTTDKIGAMGGVHEPERSAEVAGPSGDEPAQRNEPAPTPVGSEPAQSKQSDPVRNWSASDLQAP